MKKYLSLLPELALFAACEQKTETTAAPGAAPEKKVNNTTVVAPAAGTGTSSSTDTKTKTSMATDTGGSATSSSTTTTTSTPHR